MLRLAYPLVLLAALAAGRAHAQAGDRYGPRPAPYAGPAPAATPSTPVHVAFVPALRSDAPALRTLSWPGKAELRPALAPAVAPVGPSADDALRTAPVPTGRFPGMGAYAAPAPSLRPAPSYADAAAPATRSAPARTMRRRASAVTAPPPATAPATATAPVAAPASPGRTPAQSNWSNLPAGLAAPPAYVPPGPVYGPALAAEARDTARTAAVATTDTLPPPTVGRYGYVGPGRTAAPPAQALPQPTTPTPTSHAATALGPPRPPAYARSYVMPAQASPAPSAAPTAAPAAPGPTASRGADSARRYSVHREYGMEPDPVPVPPQFFAATADLSAPETPPPVPRNGKAAANAARLAAAGG